MNLVEVYTQLKTAYPQIITDEDLKAEMMTFYSSVSFVKFMSVIPKQKAFYMQF